jgi:DNA-binding transcriptional regulator YhcF (GntR family)
MQCNCRLCYEIDAPNAQTIRRCYEQFEDTGCLCNGKNTVRSLVSKDNPERIRESFQPGPYKSTIHAIENW